MLTITPPPARRFGAKLLWLLPALLLSACEPKLETPEPTVAAGNSSSDASLNNKGDGRNPFSVAVMREALQKLKMRQQKLKANGEAGTQRPIDDIYCPECIGDQPGGGDIQPTHYYVRFKPADVDQLADLEQSGFNLFFEPLDENAAAGYSAPPPGSAELPWIYTTVPAGTYLPSYIQQERLEKLYLASVDAGDERDADPWTPTPTPDPKPCKRFDASCGCYVPCPVAAETTNPTIGGTNASQPVAQNRNLQKEAADQLRKQGISPLDLYNEAMHITGHDDEVIANSESSFLHPDGTDIGAITQGTRKYHPSGNIMVQRKDSRSLTNVPLRRVNVLSRRWFKLDHAYTDANGRFYINKGYNKKAKLIVEFKTDQATTRGFNNSMDPWDVVLPIRHQMGLYSETQMENMNYTFSYQTDGQSKGALSWTAATAFNTLYDVYNYATANGIPTPPQDMNIWLASDFTKGGSTPMLRKLAETSTVSQFVDYILPLGGKIFKRVMQRQIPDITIRFAYSHNNTTYATYDIDELLSHELGHSIHYKQVGNNYWTSYIKDIVVAGGYGRKTDNDAGRIAISEAWGYYTGYNFTSQKYQAIDLYLSNYYGKLLLEDQIPSNDIYDYNKWIVFGMLYDMTDNKEDFSITRVVDNVNSYNTAQVFKGLQSDIISVRQYQQRILTQNSSKQAPELEQLVTSYFW